MTRPLVDRSTAVGWLGLVALAFFFPLPATLAQSAASPGTVPGQFLAIQEPITTETITQVKAATRRLLERGSRGGTEPILVFEFRPAPPGAGATEFGAAYDLANYLSTRLGGARLTVAFVPEPLEGYAVLPALSCDEIVMGSTSSIGPITPADQQVDPALREPLRLLAQRKGRDPELLAGMLDRDLDLRAARTADKQVHFVPADALAAFRASHQVTEERPAWEGGQRGVLTSARAREHGFTKLTADSASEVARAYHLASGSVANDPTLGREVRPVWIQVLGPIDAVKQSYVARRIDQARREGVNLVFFQFNSRGGVPSAADAVADLIANAKDMKTVAYVDDRALGVATLPVLACNEIVFGPGSAIGDVRQVILGRDDGGEQMEAREVQSLATRAAQIAEQQGHPAAVARAMVDPNSVLLEAKDTKTGAGCFVLQSQVDAEPGRYVESVTRKEAGSVLTVSAEEATAFGLGQHVADEEGLKALHGLRGRSIRVDGPNWVDSLVTVLNDPFVGWFLLFIGLFMLVLELKLPGIGLPAITSALAFLLFFWSRYLSGTADQLEIILFLVGLVCLALEIFVFPGMGVFGLSGVLLILTSIVLASHTFVWPTQEYEYRQLGHTLLQVIVALGSVLVGAALFGRYFPSLPVFNRLVLKAEPWDAVYDDEVPDAIPSADMLLHLIGETGRTTTVLRPSGKARFGDRLLDVTAANAFIEPDSLIEVIDVQGTRIVVKAVVD